MRRPILALLGFICTITLGTGQAHADVGGEVPSPGLCEYPFVGHSFMIGAGPVANVYGYMCNGPVEENGSHWHAELYGESVQAAVQAGITMMFINASISATGNLGAIGGWTGFVCPDGTQAGWPNPPAAWKVRIYPSKCQTVGPTPQSPLAPPPPPVAEVKDPPPGPLTPAVTDPANPNPDATTNPR